MATRWRCETAVEMPPHHNKKTTIHLHCPSRFILFTSISSDLSTSTSRPSLSVVVVATVQPRPLLSGCSLGFSSTGHKLHQASRGGPVHPSGPVEESPAREGAGAGMSLIVICKKNPKNFYTTFT